MYGDDVGLGGRERRLGLALLGALATSTPLGWAPWIGAVGLGLIAATVWQVRAHTRKA